MTERNRISAPAVQPVEEPICPLCLEHNPIGEELCRRCRTPLVQITGPKFEPEGDGEAYRKPIVLIGTWLINLPMAATGLGLLICAAIAPFRQPTTVGMGDCFGMMIVMAISGGMLAIPGTVLFRATRTFVRHRNRRRQGFQPVMADPSDDDSASP